MSEIKHWRIWCNDDSQFEEVWSDEAPTVCPVNNTHSVNTTLTSAYETVSESIIQIKEELITTGGNFMCESVCILSPTGPNSTATEQFTWPFPITVMSLSFNTDYDNSGDYAYCSVAPDTIIGVLGVSCATGATGFYVSPTVTENTMIGYHLNLFDGPNTDNLGRVISIDSATNYITTEFGPSRSYSNLSPTYIRQTVYVINNYRIGKPGTYGIGKDKIGGSYVPKYTVVRVGYINEKSFSNHIAIQIDYLY